MRVVHVAPRFPPAEGGGERHVARLTAALAARGHDVRVLTTKLRTEVPLRLDPALPDEESVEGVRVERLPLRATGLPVWGYGYRLPTLRDRVAALRPEVVHAHGWGYLVNDQLARARRDGAPWRLVLTSHGFVAGRGPMAAVKPLYDATRGRATARALDAAIAIAPPDADVFRRLGARRVEVVPNGVELQRFERAAVDGGLLRRQGLAPQGYALSVGRLEKVKGHDRLLEAFARIAPAHPRVALVLVGEGAREGALRGLAESLGIGGAVRFMGRLPDEAVASLMKGALLFAHTPRDEPFGIVLLEAMAAGLPVLATRVGGIPFVVEDAALLVEPVPDAIAEGLARLAADKALRDRLAERGRARAGALTWEANAARVEALYRSLA